MDSKKSQRLETIARELEKRKKQHQVGGGRKRWFRRVLRKLFMTLALVFIALAMVFIFNFLRLNSDLIEGHIKQGIIPNLTQGRFDLDIGAISGNLLYGVEMDNVLVQNPHFKTGATLVTVPKVALNYSLVDIFFGRLVLQKVVIKSPSVVLKRNEDGRAIWDFTTSTDKQTRRKQETVWQERDRAQTLADSYLTDIQITDLSILVPAPDTLIADEFASRLIVLPKRTFQLSNIDIFLRKYPAESFENHILRVVMPDDPDFLRFQLTRIKSSGNFTVAFDALGHNYNVAVENLGQEGRKINIFDGRNRERLNLEWVWAREPHNIPEKIRGLNGVLQVHQFSDLFSNILPEQHELTGNLSLEVSCMRKLPVYDANVELKLTDSLINLPYLPVIEDLNLVLMSSERVAELARLAFKTSGVESVHSGRINFADATNISGQLDSELEGDSMRLLATYSREVVGTYRFASRVERKSGSAQIEFLRQIADRAIIYRDFDFSAGIAANGSALEIFPMNLLPAGLADQLKTYFNRVDLLGPLNITTSFPAVDDWQTSIVDLEFIGARIQNKLNPQDSVVLHGKAVLASSALSFDDFAASIDNFKLRLSGDLTLSASQPYILDYKLEARAGVDDNKSFAYSAERLQKTLGLSNKPDFDTIEITGNNILAFMMASDAVANQIKIDLPSLKFFRRGKALWADKVKANLSADAFNLAQGEQPARLEVDTSLELFGIPVEAAMTADLIEKSVENLQVKGGGGNFSRIIAAIKTQPEGAAFFKKHPLNVNGNFSFAFLGSGNLQNPTLEGWLRFPTLNFSMPDFNARLPFYLQLKTSEDGYDADVNAGDAVVKVKDVVFDLGKTSAEMQIRRFFASDGPDFGFKGTSKVFGATLSATGDLALGKQRFNNFNLSLQSSDIERFANEIARIGRFAVPFKLAGKFNANARLSGPFSSPASSGNLSLSSIKLDFPLFDGAQKTVLQARNMGGKLTFSKATNSRINLALKDFNGNLLDARVSLDGKAHLRLVDGGFKPVIDNLEAGLQNLEARRFYTFMQPLLPQEISKTLKITSGAVSGRFTVSGDHNRLMARGSAHLTDAGLSYPLLKHPLEQLSSELQFEGRTDSGYSRIGVKNLAAKWGRSDFSVSEGWLEDPTRTAKMSLSGRFGKIFPQDIINLLGGMTIGSLSFPKEGWLDGEVRVDGTLSEPMVEASLSSTEMTVHYESDGQAFTVPIGQNLVEFSLNPSTGRVALTKAELGLLDGRISLDKAEGLFLPTRPFEFEIMGNMGGIDFSRLYVSGIDGFSGVMGGDFKAFWRPDGPRDAVFNLKFDDIKLASIPMVDPEAIKQVNVDFIESPDFRHGELNFYVTSDEEHQYQGRLLIADGLFAGPHLRLEVGNSEFNPLALNLDARVMINPQSLRRTKIGRKLGRWTVTAQDRATGVPYVDLSVAGSWSNPELLSRKIKRRAEGRVKGNIFRRIFGRHRPHKASVEELMEWFPGWKKGM